MLRDWARYLRDQCVDAGVPFFFKQWGEWVGGEDFYDEEGSCVMASLDNGNLVCEDDYPEHAWTNWSDATEDGRGVNDPVTVRVGKKAAGRLLDGREWNELPETEGVAT